MNACAEAMKAVASFTDAWIETSKYMAGRNAS